MLVVIAKPHIEFVTEQYFLCCRGLNGDRYSASTHRLAWCFLRIAMVPTLPFNWSHSDMSDTLTPAQRSYNMSRIRSRKTSPERAVRHALWNKGENHPKNRQNPHIYGVDLCF